MGKHITLRLKVRPVRGDFAQISLEGVRALINMGPEAGGRQALDLLRTAAETAPNRVEHDCRWLLEIAQFVPPGREGINFVEAARWFPLIQRLVAIDDTKEALFKISESQSDLIFDRLKNNYPLQAIPVNFALFCLAFWETIGRRPDSIKPDDDFNEEEGGEEES